MSVRIGIVGAIALLAIGLQGCTAALLGGGAAAGAGAVAYSKGEYQRVYEAPVDRTAQAAVAALEQLDLVVDRREQVAPDQTRIEANKPDGTRITVALTPGGPETTMARIRVGVLGDEGLSRLIDRRIAENLGTR
jgi:hypothetical protein